MKLKNKKRKSFFQLLKEEFFVKDKIMNNMRNTVKDDLKSCKHSHVLNLPVGVVCDSKGNIKSFNLPNKKQLQEYMSLLSVNEIN